MQSPVKETKWYSWCTGKLSKGCTYCVQGRKLVLFITGLCAQKCFYCPISEQKFGKDVVFANESKIQDPTNPVEMLKEVELTEAYGAGITGGDPLMNVDRCCAYIKILKSKFGKQFHIHLYTPLKLVNNERLQRLYEAGLDEIRVHPSLDDNSLWDRVNLAKQFNWTLGAEIPAIPGYDEKTKVLIDYLSDKVSFININELELSDTQTTHYKLGELNYHPKDYVSYGVKGSQEMALRMLEYSRQKNLSAHFCTAKLKDAVQVRKRLQLRAKHVALPSDEISEDGTLIRGCIYSKELTPGKKESNKEKATEELKAKLDLIKKELKLSSNEVMLDKTKSRILVSHKKVRSNNKRLKKMNLIPAIVEEYPTADAFEVEVEFL